MTGDGSLMKRIETDEKIATRLSRIQKTVDSRPAATGGVEARRLGSNSC